MVLPLLNEERPVVDAPETQPEPVGTAKDPAEAPKASAKAEEKAPEKSAEPDKTSNSSNLANPAKKGDNPNKITAQKVGTGGNI